MHKSSCLCGAVRYELTGPLGAMVFCHCPDCRKAKGGAFAAVAPVAAVDFHLLAGSELLTEYESLPGKKQVFCGRCGTPVYSQRDADPAKLGLRLGPLDTPVNEAPVVHIWVGSKAPWEEICGLAPQYEKFERARKPGTSG